MAVERIRNRRETIILTGPLHEIYAAAGPEIEDYISRGWTFIGSKTNPNAGPMMQLDFAKEKD